MENKMQKSQINYGYEKLKEYGDKHNLTEEKAVEILRDIKGMREFYGWVNADNFLDQYEGRQSDE